jgi:hypothetical protein
VDQVSYCVPRVTYPGMSRVAPRFVALSQALESVTKRAGGNKSGETWRENRPDETWDENPDQGQGQCL